MIKLEVQWQVCDGYAGGARPHTTTVHLYPEDEDTDQDIELLIEEAIQHDFNERVAWATSERLSDVVADARRLLDAEES